MNTPIKETQLQCPTCKNWSRSAIQFANEEVFEESGMSGNTTRCPHCGNLDMPLSKANMRWNFAAQAGGYSGDDTQGPHPKKA